MLIGHSVPVAVQNVINFRFLLLLSSIPIIWIDKNTIIYWNFVLLRTNSEFISGYRHTNETLATHILIVVCCSAIERFLSFWLAEMKHCIFPILTFQMKIKSSICICNSKRIWNEKCNIWQFLHSPTPNKCQQWHSIEYF